MIDNQQAVSLRKGISLCVAVLLCQVLFSSVADSAWIGLLLQDYRGTGGGTTAGVELIAVQKGSPAEQAGLRPEDVIVAVNGKGVAHSRAVTETVFAAAPGDSLALKIRRGKDIIHVLVVLGELPAYLVRYHEGVRQTEDREYARAIVSFTKALQDNPTMADAFDKRAYAYFLQGRYDLAIEDATEAIRLQPVAGFFLTRGRAYRETRYFRKAVDDFTRALALRSSPDGYFERAVACADAGNTSDALADLKHATDLDPLFGDAFRMRASLLRKRGDEKAAAADEEKAARAYIDQGLRFAGEGLYDKALAHYGAGIKLNGTFTPVFFYNSGLAHEKKGDFAQAVNSYSEAIRHDPGFAKAYLRRGYVYAEKLGQETAAKSDWEKAVQLDPQGDDGRKAALNLEQLRKSGL